ncbi:MAG TPA: hypothetical protein VEU30_06825 [Thermoanaerobaculia bacterium]|nr:hypothetical protein [Thermoanaerobaculia bacterium]
MKKIKQIAAVFAVGALFAASTFAEERPRNGSDGWRGGRGDNRNDGRYERNERRDDRNNRGARNLSAQGRVSSVHRHGDGYRVQLDRNNQWYYVPSNAWRGSRGNGRNWDLRVGVSIRLGGGYYGDGGYVHVSEADYYDDYGYRDRGYNDGFIAGTVIRVSDRRDVIELREERTGRRVTVDARVADRRGNRRGIDVSDLRRGDYVELEGEWIRGNVFQAYRIDGVDSRR